MVDRKPPCRGGQARSRQKTGSDLRLCAEAGGGCGFVEEGECGGARSGLWSWCAPAGGGSVAGSVFGACPLGVGGAGGSVDVAEVPGLVGVDEVSAAGAGDGSGFDFGCPFGSFGLVSSAVAAACCAAFAWH